MLKFTLLMPLVIILQIAIKHETTLSQDLVEYLCCYGSESIVQYSHTTDNFSGPLH